MNSLTIFYLLGLIYLIDGIKDLAQSLKKHKPDPNVEKIVVSDEMHPSELMEQGQKVLKHPSMKFNIFNFLLSYGPWVWLFLGFKMDLPEKYWFFSLLLWEVSWLLFFAFMGLRIGLGAVMNMRKAKAGISNVEEEQDPAKKPKRSINVLLIQSLFQVFAMLVILIHHFKPLLY